MVNGATTLYENWNIAAKSDISLNHIMFGDIGAWLYKGIGGIQPDEANPGFKNVLLTPAFMDELNYFTAEHTGRYGKIISSWKRIGKTIRYTVSIPANSTATIRFPAEKKVYSGSNQIKDTSTYQLSSGSYEFIIK